MTDRIQSVQRMLEAKEALIIMSPVNRKYFTGFSASAGTLLITKNSADFLIDFRYYEKASETIKFCNVILFNRIYAQLNELLEKYEITTIYIETSYMELGQYKSLQSNLSSYHISVDDKFDQFILKLRSIKSAEELKSIEAAQKITDDTFSYILDRITAGRTEREIMLDMEFYLRRMGSEGVSFDFIVVSGKNSSMPHGVPTDKKIEKGDFITMDFGAVIDGYRSDMTRTVAFGNVNDEQREVYETVLEAQKRAFEQIAPGVPCLNVDRAARAYIADNGYDGCFGHGLGHSIGLEVHESPCFNTRDETPLKPGMILSVEPGIYLPGKFGVRIEDLVYITEDGFKNLTASPKELIVL